MDRTMTTKEIPLFPFTALSEMDRLKTALIIAAIDPSIGGVLAIGEKGSAKSTVVRSFARLLPGNGPFVELPMGATEDMLAGTIDVEHAIKKGEKKHLPGIMARANNGILYVDEVNLLANHLVDIILDAAASGVVKVERDGISTSYPSRFILAGTMNPEEGGLRPQLLDRFGLCVQVISPTDPLTRSAIVKRRIEFDNDPAGFLGAFEEEESMLAHRISIAKPAYLPDELLDGISALCTRLSLSGMRGDITCAKAAAALAGFNGRSETSVDDVRAVALMSLSHRRKRDPLKDDYIFEEEMEEALNAVFGSHDNHGSFNYSPDLSSAVPSDISPTGHSSDTVPSTANPGGDSTSDNSAENAPVAIHAPSVDAGSYSAGGNPSSPGDMFSAGELEGNAINPSSNAELQDTDISSSESNDHPTKGDLHGRHVGVKGDLNFLSGVGDPAGMLAGNRTGGPQRLPGSSNSFSQKAHGGMSGRQTTPMPLSSSASKYQYGSVALAATINRAATRNAVDNAIAGDDLHYSVNEYTKKEIAGEPEQSLAVKVKRADIMVNQVEVSYPEVSIICLDASGSMGLNGRIDIARSILESLLYSSYRKREKVAIVSFHDMSADILLQPTGSLEVARARIDAVETGGRTPLAQGILKAGELADQVILQGYVPTIILLSDGHATYAPRGNDPYKEAIQAALSIQESNKRCIMVDTSDGSDMLRLSSNLAEAMGAILVDTGNLDIVIG